MPNSVTTQTLQSLAAQLSSTSPGSQNFQSVVSGVYNTLSAQGYGYASLANGLVNCSASSVSAMEGNTALNFMSNYATTQGITLSSTQVQSIELGMATQYIQTLMGVAQASGTNTVNTDITYQQAADFHNTVFEANGLNPAAWTLSAPGQVLSSASMESVWEQIISPNSSTSAL